MVEKVVGYENHRKLNTITGRYETKSVAIKAETPMYNDYQGEIPLIGKSYGCSIDSKDSSLTYVGIYMRMFTWE
jgi:hypothetical protein